MSFYVSLIIAFAVFNWRAIFYLFYIEEKWGIRERMLYLHEKVYAGRYTWPVFIGPLLSAVAVNILIPLLTDLLDDVVVWSKTWQYNRHQNIETRKREIAGRVAQLNDIIKQKDSQLAAKNEELRTEQGRVDGLLRRFMKMDAHLASNLRILKQSAGKSALIKEGRNDLLFFGLAEANEDGTLILSGRGFRFATSQGF